MQNQPKINIISNDRYINENKILAKSGSFALLSLFIAAFVIIMTIAAYAWSDSATGNNSSENTGSTSTENIASEKGREYNLPANAPQYEGKENSGNANLPPIKKKGNLRTNTTVPTDRNSANNPSTNEGKLIDKDHPAPNSPAGSENLR